MNLTGLFLGLRGYLFIALTLACAVLFPGEVISAEPLSPRTIDRQISKAVALLLQNQHLSKTPLNDEIAGLAFDELFQRFDSFKLYFEQRDLDEFSKERNALDQQFAAGDISFVFKVWTKYVERLGERTILIEELLKEKPDFTITESIVTDSEQLKFAANPEELRERWRKRIKYELLVLKGEQVEGAAASTRLTKRYSSFADRMRQLAPDELLEHFLNSFAAAYGAGTYYSSPYTEEAARGMGGSNLQGIGAALNVVDGQLQVSTLVAGGAAAKYGKLRVGDQIISVAQGENGEAVDVREMKLNDAVKLIRGVAGSVVRLGVISSDSNQPAFHNITRAKIEFQEVIASGLVLEESKKANGSPYKVGVIKIPSIYMDVEGAREGKADYKSCTRDVAKILKEFRDQQVDVVLLDLRDIFSGQLSETLNLTGLFIDIGPIVQVKTAEGRVQHHDDIAKGMDWKGPLVLLTNKFSGGTSEILIGAIQDYGRGLVLGDETTTGFGSIASSIELGPQLFRVGNAPKMGTLVITMQQLYRPSGQTIYQRGVVPDLIIPSLTTGQPNPASSRLQRGLKLDNVPAVPFEKAIQTTQETLAKLKSASEQRRSLSSDFTGLLRQIQQAGQKEKGTVSLREDEFFARKKTSRVEESADTADANRIVKRDFYFNEVLAIATDYGSLLTAPTAPLPQHEPGRELTAAEKLALEREQVAEKERMATGKARLAVEQERLAELQKLAKEKAEGWRTWTSTAGTKIDAKFKGMIDKKVKLEKRDGTTVMVPANLLSEDDLSWIKGRR